MCSRAISTLPTIHMAGPILSISSPTVRIVHRVHQTSKTCHNIPSDTQYSSPHLFGRYSHSGFRYKNIKRTNRSGFRTFAKPGVYNKLREICTDSFARHGVSRTSSRLQNYDVLPTVTQGDKNNRTMQRPASKQNGLAARARPVTGGSRVNTASSMAGSASLQTSSIYRKILYLTNFRQFLQHYFHYPGYSVTDRHLQVAQSLLMVAQSQLMGSHEDRWRMKFPPHRPSRHSFSSNGGPAVVDKRSSIDVSPTVCRFVFSC